MGKPDSDRVFFLQGVIVALTALAAVYVLLSPSASSHPPVPPVSRQKGFTLIELSIVQVVIGLLVGGVLVGQDLIKAAEVRAQITQIEKFNTAANTFYGKYGSLPGDLGVAAAAQYGFPARSGIRGDGDTNGLIEGASFGYNSYFGWQQAGETLLFWEDLSASGLIEGAFNIYQDGINPTATSAITSYFPEAKIGNSNAVYVYSTAYFNVSASNSGGGTATNFFGLSVPVVISGGNLTSTVGLTVAQSYNIDTKVDDGSPQSGRVQADYVTGGVPPYWAAGGGAAGASPGTAASPSSTTCYDNGGSASNVMAYSLAQNNGAGVNCALSFKMQAGD